MVSISARRKLAAGQGWDGPVFIGQHEPRAAMAS
jgi:hypothetical protein